MSTNSFVSAIENGDECRKHNISYRTYSLSHLFTQLAAKNGQVSRTFAAAKNGQVSRKIPAARNGQVSRAAAKLFVANSFHFSLVVRAIENDDDYRITKTCPCNNKRFLKL